MGVSSEHIAEWQTRFGQMATAWSALASGGSTVRRADWPDAFARLRREYLGLRASGRWVSGPRDLLTIAGATDDEVSHSRVVAWLLLPTGRHGLGTRILARTLEAGWPDAALPDLDAVDVVREVRRPVETGETRADVVVRAGPTVLVIENKVWSPEAPCQCESLYQHWIDETEDVRFLLLSRDGHLPLTAVTEDARNAWRALSYRRLAGLLTELGAGLEAEDIGRSVLSQYTDALHHLVGAALPFAITRRSQR